jgi:hypothetical protein
MSGFFSDAWHGIKKGAQVAVNVGRVVAIPVTGGGSLLIPKAHWADKKSAPPPAAPPPPPPPDQALLDAAAAATAAAQQVQQQVQQSSPPVSYASDNSRRLFSMPATLPGVQPFNAGQYIPQAPPNPYAMGPLPTPGSGTPPWLLPVGIGAAALAALYLLTRKSNN